jgi:hypothetical protein
LDSRLMIVEAADGAASTEVAGVATSPWVG